MSAEMKKMILVPFLCMMLSYMVSPKTLRMSYYVVSTQAALQFLNFLLKQDIRHRTFADISFSCAGCRTEIHVLRMILN